MPKRPITFFKVLCALCITGNVHKPISLLGFSGATWQKLPESCNLLQLVQNFLKHSCFLLAIIKKLQFRHT
jgi:hypothetical protein